MRGLGRFAVGVVAVGAAVVAGPRIGGTGQDAVATAHAAPVQTEELSARSGCLVGRWSTTDFLSYMRSVLAPLPHVQITGATGGVTFAFGADGTVTQGFDTVAVSAESDLTNMVVTLNGTGAGAFDDDGAGTFIITSYDANVNIGLTIDGVDLGSGLFDPSAIFPPGSQTTYAYTCSGDSLSITPRIDTGAPITPMVLRRS